MNVVMTGDGRLVEVQATAEQDPFSRELLDRLLDLAAGGIAELERRPARGLRGPAPARPVGRRAARPRHRQPAQGRGARRTRCPAGASRASGSTDEPAETRRDLRGRTRASRRARDAPPRRPDAWVRRRGLRDRGARARRRAGGALGALGDGDGVARMLRGARRRDRSRRALRLRDRRARARQGRSSSSKGCSRASIALEAPRGARASGTTRSSCRRARSGRSPSSATRGRPSARTARGPPPRSPTRSRAG